MALQDLFQHNAPYYDGLTLQSTPQTLVPQIRLLRIHTGHFSDPIACELSVVPLRDVKYIALSYVWGDCNTSYSIKVNGKPGFRVTENAYAALRRLRREAEAVDDEARPKKRRVRAADVISIESIPMEFAGPQFGNRIDPQNIWIDAICINQANIKERNTQVSLMGEIYHLAIKVVAWLGPCGSHKQGSGEQKLCSQHEDHEDFSRFHRDVLPRLKLKTSDQQLYAAAEARYSKLLPCMDTNISSMWWGRAWTVS